MKLAPNRRVTLLRGPFVVLLMLLALSARAQQVVAPGVWFLLGDSSKGYSNTVVIEMQQYLVVVDANYPGRARELLTLIPKLSPKPVRYVFDTHHHGDHAYGNAVWTRAGATTMAFAGVAQEMDRWEPKRWLAAKARRSDMADLPDQDVERPKLILQGGRYVLKDRTREIDFLHFGWGHTRGDGFVWLPRECILATGDAAVNGPRNKLLDAWIEHWPLALDQAIALSPQQVLPGHGSNGGAEILTGQRRFLVDLYQAVAAHPDAAPADLRLPTQDANWIPKDLTQDVETVRLELQARAPAGSLPHEWR